MLNDFLNSNNSIKKENFQEELDPQEFQKDFVDKFVDNFMNVDKQNPQLKYECKILPYEESNSGKELFKCPLCQTEKIEGRKHLTDHLHQHQLQYRPCDGKHLCCLCGKELSSNSSLERHLLTHSNHRPFDCQLCGKKFTTNGNLSRHIKASHGPNFTPVSTPNDLHFLKSNFESVNTNNTQNFSISTPPNKNSSVSNINSPIIPSPSMAFNVFSLPNLGLPMNPNNILVKLIEDSLKAYQNVQEPFQFFENEALNLSTKSNHPFDTKKEYLSLPEINVSNESLKMSNTSKRIAKKISQKYRDRRASSKQKFIQRTREIFDAPLDLSINKSSSPTSELNSFLSSSSDNFLSPVKTDYGSDYEESSKFKLKKNSYKDAPKLIRCPMNGCTQKFPWNSSLMRHILTHTAHKPFQCIRCSKCFSTKSNRERHMHRVHGIKVNRSRSKSSISPDRNICGSIKETFSVEYSKSSNSEFLSEQEWIQMSSSDRKAEDISHSLLKQAGDPVIEPNPHRQLFQMKTLLTI